MPGCPHQESVVAEMVIVVAHQQRKDKSSPELAQISPNVVAELADAVGEHCIGPRLALGESEETVGGKEGNPVGPVAVESGDHRDAAALGVHKPVFCHADASFRCQRERENFTGGDVPGVVGLGKLGDSQTSVRERHDRLWPRTAQGRSGAEEEPKVLGRLGFAVDGVGRVQKRGQLHDGRNPPIAGRQERAAGISSKTKRTNPRRIIEGQNVVQILVRLRLEDMAPHRPPDEDAAPAVRPAVLQRTKEA